MGLNGNILSPERIAELLRLQTGNDGDAVSVGTPVPSRRTVLAIDRSPSMDERDWAPSRLEAAKSRALEYVQASAAEGVNNEVAIVAYAEYAEQICPFTACSKPNEIERRVKSIRSNPSTNIAAALSLAYDLFQNAGRTAHGEGLVHLLTDGHHNCKGDPRVMANALKGLGVVIDVVGIGGNASAVNESLLRELASDHPEGGKRYQFIADPKRLSLHYQKLAGRLTL